MELCTGCRDIGKGAGGIGTLGGADGNVYWTSKQARQPPTSLGVDVEVHEGTEAPYRITGTLEWIRMDGNTIQEWIVIGRGSECNGRVWVVSGSKEKVY